MPNRLSSPLASPSATIARLQELDRFTKKSLGQHFLINDQILGHLLDLADLRADDTVIEVGPGIGTLTLALQDRVALVIAIEFDEGLIEPLRELSASRPGGVSIEVIEADAAKLLRDPPALLLEGSTKVVSNLPYQVAATVVLRAFENLPLMTSATVMVQKEVADRMGAKPGSKDYSAYTVKLALLAQVIDRFEVASNNFLPPPRVASTVIRLDRIAGLQQQSNHGPVIDYHEIKQVIDASFGMRRKTLRNNLRTTFSVSAVDVALSDTGIDGSVRAETLDTAQFIALAQALS